MDKIERFSARTIALSKYMFGVAWFSTLYYFFEKLNGPLSHAIFIVMLMTFIPFFVWTIVSAHMLLSTKE